MLKHIHTHILYRCSFTCTYIVFLSKYTTIYIHTYIYIYNKWGSFWLNETVLNSKLYRLFTTDECRTSEDGEASTGRG